MIEEDGGPQKIKSSTVIELNEIDVLLLAIMFLLFCYVLYLLRKNSVLKETIRSDRSFYQSQEVLEERFRNISNEILLSNHQSFLSIAKETFDKVMNFEKAELDRKQANFLNLIQPIQNTLKTFDSKISQIEKDRVDSYSDLRRQVSDLMHYQQMLQKETSSLNKALSTPFITGQWGEMQLRRVVELSGMMSHCDFYEQQHGEDTRLRPDMIIRLPGERNIIVDAKAPVDAYIQAINSDSADLLDDHAKRVRAHIRVLSQKAYWEQFSSTPEFVLMFLPGESFFSSAIKKDPTLVEFGIQQKVIIATPITLIALLKTISFSWRQEAIAQNAKMIGEVGRNLYYGLQKFIEHIRNFEKRLQKNLEEYEKIDKFLEKKVIPMSQKLKSLGIDVEQNSVEDQSNILGE